MKNSKNILRSAATAAFLLIFNTGANAQHVTVGGNVYGGGNMAPVGRGTTVLVNQAGAVVTGDVYGGGALAKVDTVRKGATPPAVTTADSILVTILQGTIRGDVYGGGLGNNTTAADVFGPVHVSIGRCLASTPEGSATLEKNVFGGNNLNGTPKDSVVVDIWKTAHTLTNTRPTDNYYTTTVKPALEAAKATDTYNYATQCSYFALQGVYGGSNKAPYEPVAGKGTRVWIHNCDNTVKMVYGGGRAAAVGSTTTNADAKVIVDGGLIDTLFAGGDGHTTVNGGAYAAGTNEYLPAHVYGNVTGVVRGGYYTAVFAGSNTSGNITGTKTMTISNDGPCARVQDELITSLFGGANAAPVSGEVALTVACGAGQFDEVYGGSNMADITGNVTLTIQGGTIGNVFGGSKGTANKAANILAGTGTNKGNVTLNLQGGTIDNAFGGSNINGNIDGQIIVNVNDAENETCPLYVTNIYGAGNQTAYTPASGTGTPEVNVNHIRSGNSVTGSVYGGGYGTTATVTANPQVTIGDDNASHYATVGTNVYGGGALASVVGSPTVTLKNAHTSVGGKVFGAGKGRWDTAADTSVAKVTGTATVEMQDGHVEGSIYGGGEMATVGNFHFATTAEATAYNSTNTGASMVAGDVSSSISGGTTSVTISGGTVGPASLDPIDINAGGNVFGGGLGMAGSDYSNFAYVNTANVTISGTALVRGSVFGGGENGHVKGNTNVTVSGGTVGERIKYRYRAISSDEGVSNPVYAGNVYGGGRGVDHTSTGHLSQTAGRVYGNTNVTVYGTAHIRHSVYGGGSLASVGTYALTNEETVFGGHLHNFIGETGDATVTVSGGRIGPSWDDLNYDEAGNYLLDGNGDPISNGAYTTLLGKSASTQDTLAKNYAHLGENEGMVYGSGRGVNYIPNDNDVDHQLYVELAFTRNTHVTIDGTADVVGSVFGGGENGHVKANTLVDIDGGTIGGIPLHHKGFYLPGHSEGHGQVNDDNNDDDEMAIDGNGTGKVIFRGNVYGGGRGIDHSKDDDVSNSAALVFSISAGRVYGNTQVNVTGGNILHNVFGGGSIASVGTYHYPVVNAVLDWYNSNPVSVEPNTGTTTVDISGGRVGVMGENEGYVYGGGRGVAGGSNSQVTHMAFVNETHVYIRSVETAGSERHADVRASVFGGGMNGHVLGDTYVTMSGGVVGGKTAAEYGSYDVINFPSESQPSSADTTIHGIPYFSGIRSGDTITDNNGRGPATVFLGNVYGGGRGVDHYGSSNTNLSMTAGRVYGNTNLEVSGGVVYHSIFGGGSIASVGLYELYTSSDVTADQSTNERYRIAVGEPKVLDTTTNAVTPASGRNLNSYRGVSTVTVSGGRIGTNGRNNGRVFGSSRGMAGPVYRGLGYVNIAHVNIEGGWVKGSVFGSGENGHVLDSTLVTISGGEIGNGKRKGNDAWMNNYIGNVYGGGRGLDRSSGLDETVSPFAGRVYRTANVVVTDGHVHQNVYGGGSLASVGRYKRNITTNELVSADDTFNGKPHAGVARVTVSGGEIGIDGDENGHVFGSSRGTATSSNDIQASLAYTHHTVVNIEDGTIHGSVFGGGESGHVQGNTEVSVSGGEIGSAIPEAYANCSDAEKGMYDLMGNVYGGGRGVDPYKDGSGNTVYSMSAGYVRGNTTVSITNNPTIHRNVYGGGSMGLVGLYGPYGVDDYYRGYGINGLATVTIEGPVGTSDDVANGYGGNVFGSSRGRANDPSVTSFDFADMAYVFKTLVVVGEGANVYGSVYGGGENGHVDFGGTTVNILNGHVHGNVFGGGKGSSTSPTAGIVDGDATVNIGLPTQTTLLSDGISYNTVEIDGSVFAGNDAHSSPLGTMTVNVYHTKHTAANVFPTLSDPVVASDTAGSSTASKYALKAVYGGGNVAPVLSGVQITDHSGTVLNTKYISQRLSNAAGPENGTTYHFDFDQGWPVALPRKSVVNIFGCEENTIMYVYGGGRAATTIENEVNIDGGRIYQVFAGGDGSTGLGGADVGYASLTVPQNTNHGNAKVIIKGGVVHQVFGGSNMEGIVHGTAKVNFEPTDACVLVNKETFGGGNQAEGEGNIEVTIPCGVDLQDVYGCANEADFTGNVTLIVEGGTIEHVFGGSKSADINGNVKVYVYGGTIGELYGGNNISGNITGTVEVNVDWGLNTCADATKLGYVYGGGYQAPYEPSLTGYGAVVEGAVTNYTPVVNIIQATVDSAVFGGGFGVGTTSTTDAHITANPKVVIGAYRTLDHAQNTIPAQPNNEVRIGTKLNELGRTLEGNVFGGGNAGPVEGSTKVIIQGSDTKVWHNVYGGGNAAIVKGNTDVEVGGNVLLSVPKVTQTAGTVTLTSREGATIYYTTDGTDPSTSSNEYSAPLTGLTAGTIVKAIAHKEDFAGPVKTSVIVTYTVTE